MEIDKTTLMDLSIFNADEAASIFHKFNFCKTAGGTEQLRINFSKPLTSIEEINGVQQTLQAILQKENNWPTQISNGSIMVIEKFYQATLDEIPSNPSSFAAYSYKL